MKKKFKLWVDPMDIKHFLNLLARLPAEQGWTSRNDHRCILLGRTGSDIVFSPLTAVYYSLTKKEVNRGSFWQTDIATHLRFPWWEVLEVSYASIGLDGGQHSDPKLREHMLKVLNLSERHPSKL